MKGRKDAWQISVKRPQSKCLGTHPAPTAYGREDTLVTNDARYILGTGYGSPQHFFEQAKACLDRLRNDGDAAGRMMSVGLHPRITGNPARTDGLARFIEYAQGFKDVVFMRRIDIAKMFVEHVPAP